MKLLELHDIMPEKVQAHAFVKAVLSMIDMLKIEFTVFDVLVYREKSNLRLKVSAEASDEPRAQKVLEAVVKKSMAEHDLDLPKDWDMSVKMIGQRGPPGRKRPLYYVHKNFKWDTGLRIPEKLLQGTKIRYEENVLAQV